MPSFARINPTAWQTPAAAANAMPRTRRRGVASADALTSGRSTTTQQMPASVTAMPAIARAESRSPRTGHAIRAATGGASNPAQGSGSSSSSGAAGIGGMRSFNGTTSRPARHSKIAA